MTLLHELGPQGREKHRIDLNTRKKIGNKVMDVLRWGPKITSDMLYPEPPHHLSPPHKINKIKGLPVEQVVKDPTILIAPDEDDLLMRLSSRGVGDYAKDSKRHNS